MRSGEATLEPSRERLVALATDERVAEADRAAVAEEHRDRGVALGVGESAPGRRFLRAPGQVERGEKTRLRCRCRAAFERVDRIAAPADPLAGDVRDRATAEGLGRRRPADDEAVAHRRGDRLREPKLRPAGGAGVESRALEQRDTGHHLGGAEVHLHGLVVCERTRRRREQRDARRDDRGRRERSGVRDDHAPREIVLVDASQVQRDAAPRTGEGETALVRLDPADPRAPAGWVDRDLVPQGEGPFDEGPGDDRAEPRERERAVDGQPRPADVASRRREGEHVRERTAQVVEAAARRRRHFDERRRRERRVGEGRGHARASQRGPFVVNDVALREGHDPALDAEDSQDREVLARLRHDAFVERDDEQDRVHRADPREHVADEVLMSRDIDDAHVRSAREDKPRESEVDRHPALALLAQAIGIHAGERGDERRLPVIDVARGRDDANRTGFGHRPWPASDAPRCTRSPPSRRGAAPPPGPSTGPADGIRSAPRTPRSWRRSRRDR